MPQPTAALHVTRSLESEHMELLEMMFLRYASEHGELSFSQFRSFMVHCLATSFTTRPIVSPKDAISRFDEAAAVPDFGEAALLKGISSSDMLLNKIFLYADLDGKGSLCMSDVLMLFGNTAVGDQQSMRGFLFAVTDMDNCGAISRQALARCYMGITKFAYNLCINCIGAERKAIGYDLNRGLGDLDTTDQLDALLSQCDELLASAQPCCDSAAGSLFKKLELEIDQFATKELWLRSDIAGMSPLHNLLTNMFTNALDFSGRTEYLVPALQLPRLTRAARANREKQHSPSPSPSVDKCAAATVSAAHAVEASPPERSDEAVEALRSLAMLRDAGLVDQEEYQERKAQVVDRLTSTQYKSPAPEPDSEPEPDPEPEPAPVSPATVRSVDVVLARSLFDEFDTDHNGHLDESEVVKIMIEIHIRQGKPWVKKYHSKICKQVRADLAKYDLDGNGMLEFHEFLKMLCNKPWSALLEPSSSTPLDRASLLFAEADTDKDGFLDLKELELVVAQLCSQLGKEWLVGGHGDSLVTQVAAALDRYDLNGDGKLSLDEFTVMLSNKPWGDLFGIESDESQPPALSGDGSPALRIHRRMDGSSTANRSPGIADLDMMGCSRSATVRGSSVEAAMAAADRAAELSFRKADSDGNGFIDPAELEVAADCLMAQLGPMDWGFDREELTTRAFVLFDLDHDGLIDISEWKELIQSEPWCQMLPPDARRSRHREFLKGNDQSGDERVRNRIRISAEMGAVRRAAEVPVPEEEEPERWMAVEVEIPEPAPIFVDVKVQTADGHSLAMTVYSPDQDEWGPATAGSLVCLLYTSDAADEEDSVDLGGRRIIKKKKKEETKSISTQVKLNSSTAQRQLATIHSYRVHHQL
eukprot:TRINITY_DN21936_c0_g1_i3.p1 TRINITY_DN21936_c0_g1~~TRINITY_DN21936_c0_g1_i3.p1  ORF type:complete len:873 (-),score=240.44 TRINITY_DN21936_c0_g1_i3:14-2632(-)